MLRYSLALLLTACLPLCADLSSDVNQLNQDHTQFAFSLYPTIDSVDTNLVFSPYSISNCLAMVYLGARGDTESQMQKALHLNIDRKNIAKTSFALNQSLAPLQNDNKAYKLHTANAIWVDQATFLLTDFRYAIEKQFQARLERINFAMPANATVTINHWISLQTDGKIPTLLNANDINELTDLVLTNAVYFEGQWISPFDPKLTQDWPFHPTSETSINTQMMHQTMMLPIYENELIQAVSIPFVGTSTGGGKLGLVLLLPKSADNFNQMVNELPNEFTNWLSSMSQASVDLKLPKFTLNTRLNLQAPLVHLGMEDAFDSNANFIGIDGLRDLFLNKVIHQTFFTLDENGVTAAASTAAIIGMKSTPEKTPPISFIADHPFLFFIVDLKSLEMLFMGKVVNPASSTSGLTETVPGKVNEAVNPGT